MHRIISTEQRNFTSRTMTARFLLQLRDSEWERQATNTSELSRRGSGFVINFKTTTVHDDNDDGEVNVDEIMSEVGSRFLKSKSWICQ